MASPALPYTIILPLFIVSPVASCTLPCTMTSQPFIYAPSALPGHAVYYYALALKSVGYVALTHYAVYRYIGILAFTNYSVESLKVDVFVYADFH